MKATLHSTALSEKNSDAPSNNDAVYCHNDKGVYAVASGGTGASDQGTPARVFIEVIERNVDALGQILEGADPSALAARLQQVLSQLFARASEVIRTRFGVPDGATGPQTSATLFLVSSGKAAVAHIGNTRAVMIREGRLMQLSRNAKGEGPSPLLGDPTNPVPTLSFFKVQGDDYIILTSSGVHEHISDEEMVEFSGMVDSADRLAHAYVNLGVRRSSVDTSCIVLDIEQQAEAAAEAPAEAEAPKGAPAGSPAPPSAVVPVQARPIGGPAAITPSSAPSPPAEPLENVAGHIKRYPLFEGMPAEQVDAMIALLSEVPYDAGHVIYEEGKPMTQLYLLTSGQVSLSREGGESSTVGPGAFLCETALVQGMQHRETATVVASATVLTLTQMGLAKMTVTDPQFAVRLYHNLARQLALKLETTD